MSVLCREALTGSAHQVKGCERRGPRHEGDLPVAATAYPEAARTAAPTTTTRSSTDSKERKFMDPQEIIEEPQELAGGPS